MTGSFTESIVEEAALGWFGDLGYAVLHGPEIAPGEPHTERDDYREVVLARRVRSSLQHLNPHLSADVVEEAARKALLLDSPSLLLNNRAFHRMLVNGVEVESVGPDGRVRGERVRLVDFESPEANDWLVVNQFTVIEGHAKRRPDIVVFLNGLPLAVIELKNPADENATIWKAFDQLETYKLDVPSLFAFNELLVISDGPEARVGSITAPKEWFLPWKTIEGAGLAASSLTQLEVLIRGIFDKERFLDLVRSFVVFEDDGASIAKKIAAYHQFHATRKAVEKTLLAAGPKGDHRGGVVWHTQGSGKSLTMAFFAGKLVLHPRMENPTIVVLTDRNDLDDQLFGVFARCQDLVRQTPVQAKDRSHLRKLLQVASGGVVFTTIQKFLPEEKGDRFPVLSERRNVVVIADEAHRSQYDFIDGFARHMRDALPSATFVGFTGTPLELEDRDTRNVFGDYIDIYDVQRAIDDGTTVPIYYESRLAKLDLKQEEKPQLDEEFEEITEGEEASRKEKLKSKWAALEAVVGTPKRLSLIAKDLIEHFEGRLEVMDGKAMVVCMSRRICVDLYDEIVKLRPDWHAREDEQGFVKVVMTGAAPDPTAWQPHIRNKPRRMALATRFKDPADSFKLAIVRDMWLTGFDVPSLHTMYLDKPMRGHGLMQAIARVNRVFRDKPGGLAVDYLGLADSLRQALSVYAASGGEGRAVVNQDEAVAATAERVEICRTIFHGFDYSAALTGTAIAGLSLLPAAQEHILSEPDRKERLDKAVAELSQAIALAFPRPEALAVRDEVAFFQAVKASLTKRATVDQRPEEEMEHAIRQIISKAIAPEGVIDIFRAAGLKKPDISLLSEEFLAEVRQMPQRNLAVELLRKLLDDEIKTRSRKNLVQSRSFAEMLEASIRRYQARAIETAQVIEELIALAKHVRDAQQRGEELGLSEEELAFYDALETNDSAVAVLGDETLRTIARELVQTVRRDAAIDWTVRENVRANLRRMVRRVLRKHGYPPDKQEKATQTVLEQAALFGMEVAETAPAQSAREAAFRVLPQADARPYENCIPLYSLKAAAGQFSGSQSVEPEAWVVPNGRTRPRKGLFVAQVFGESMNRRIPSGAYCVFRTPVTGSRQGRVVLVQHRDISDPDNGGQYTVKIYESAKVADEDGGWRHLEIRLKPDSTDDTFEPIVLRGQSEDEVLVLAELVEALPGIQVD